MNIQFFSLPKYLRNEYKNEYFNDSISQVRVALLAAAILYVLFFIWDQSLDPNGIEKTLNTRSFCAFIFVVCFVVSFHRNFKYFYQPLVALTVLFAGLGVIYILSLINKGMEIGISGLLLVLMFTYGFFKLYFLWSFVVGLVLVSAYNMAAYHLNVDSIVLLNNNFMLLSAIFIGSSVAYNYEKKYRSSFLLKKDLSIEKQKTDELIDDIFPRFISDRLKSGETAIADSNGEVTVLFADLVGFSELTRKLLPSQLVSVLSEIFESFDRIANKHGVQRIKIIGDCYMAADGFEFSPFGVDCAVVDAALEMIECVETYSSKEGVPVGLKIGISSGQVISGVIGLKKNSFDLWGDTVNVASRMQSTSDSGKIQVDEPTYWKLKNKYNFEDRGHTDIKGIGSMRTFFLLGRKDESPDVSSH